MRYTLDFVPCSSAMPIILSYFLLLLINIYLMLFFIFIAFNTYIIFIFICEDNVNHFHENFNH